DQLIYRPSFSNPYPIYYNSIEEITYNSSYEGKNADKHVESITIKHLIDGKVNEIKIGYLLGCDYKKLKDILTRIHTEFEDFSVEKQIVSVDELPESLKVAYIKVIINMAFENDGIIDEREFSEILLLMTRLSLS